MPWPLVLLLVAVALATATVRTHAAPPTTTTGLTPSCPAPAAGNNYSGLTLVLCNFNKADLRGARFTNATLKAVAFDGADLRNADFSGATFADSGDAMLPTDFSFANLANASFDKASFNGLTYLTYATLTCTDFSNTDISTGNAVFGPAPLVIDVNAACDAPPPATPPKPQLTRTTFAYTVMNCEFIDDWNRVDMTGAKGLSACALKGRNFSGARFDYADLSGIDLSGSAWAGAYARRANFQNATLDNATGFNSLQGQPPRTLLSGATFNKVSAKGVDFSYAPLNGADFSDAELESANFSSATLINDPKDPLGPISAAGSFKGAHLKYVNLSGATLNSVDFSYASLYGTMLVAPTGACTTDTTQCGSSPVTGWTCSCATLAGADLTDTNFVSAFLYGADFGAGTTVNGTQFTNAVLIGANFVGAKFMTNPSLGGAAPNLEGAWLQGVNLQAADLTNVSLSGAYVDFGILNADGTQKLGSRLALQLTTGHTKFRNWAGSPTPCVHVETPVTTSAPNGSPSSLPTDVPSMTCPDGNRYANGCGAMQPRDNGNGGSSPPPPPPPAPPCNTPTTNPHWCAGSVSSAAAGIVGWYRAQSTYESAATATTQCGTEKNKPDPSW